MSMALNDQTSCCGVTLAQCHVLLEIEGNAMANLGTLAQKLDLDISTLSRTVDNLVKLGYVRRETDASNRRQLLIQLSDSGRELADAINQACDTYYRRILASLPDNLQAPAISLMPVLAAAMRANRQQNSTEAGDTKGCCKNR